MFEHFLRTTELDPARQAADFLYAAKEAFDADLREARKRHHHMQFSRGLSHDVQWMLWQSFLTNEQVVKASAVLNRHRHKWDKVSPSEGAWV